MVMEALLEALAMGMVCVASDCRSGPREILALQTCGVSNSQLMAPLLGAAVEEILDQLQLPFAADERFADIDIRVISDDAEFIKISVEEVLNTLVFTIVVVVVSLLVDIITAIIDPRVRY